MHSAMERYEVQVKQKDTDYAELEEQLIKERGDLTTQIEKKNKEVEAVKTKLSKANDELLQILAKCETVEKRRQEELEAYDALLGIPRSPDRVHVREEVQHADSTERMCQFSTKSCCDGSQLCLLPCLHSACKPCIDHQVTQARQNCIQCPSCGREFNMEQIAVDHVRRNEAAYTANVDGEKKCNYIEGHHDAKAVMYCNECDDRLCYDCLKLHNRLKRNRTHRMGEINLAANISIKHWLKHPNCRDHPDNKLQLYDHTCKQAICLVCDRGAHKDHKNEDVNHAYVEAKGQLREQVQKQRLKLKDVTVRMTTVNSHQNELGNKQRKLEQDATTVFKSVAVRFLHRQRQLMKDIHASLQAPNEMVKEKLDTLHDVHTSIESTIDYIQRTLESTRQGELITLTGVLQKKSDENLKRKLPEDNTQDTRVLLSFQGQKALMELIDTFGGLASSLDLDHFPDKQPTLQDLHKQNKQLALKEEETRAVHEGRWHRLGEMIRRITGSATSGDGSQGLQPEQLTPQDLRHEQLTQQERRPQQLTPQEVYEVTCFILGASFLSESPSRGLLLRGYSSPIHIINKNRSVIFITCPKLQLDAARANTDWCHVNTGGQLVNSRPAKRHTDRGRLQKYRGTCTSTLIPLDPCPSSVTPAPNITRYWETHSRVGLVSALYGLRGIPVLEMGVVEESQVDSGMYVYPQRRSWCVSVRNCTAHGSICTMVWQQEEEMKCYGNTMSATRGTQATLHYGVVLDVGRGRLAFIDLDRQVVLAKADVEFREALLPVFGVGLPDLVAVTMKLISGEEIVMTDTKRSLINEALA